MRFKFKIQPYQTEAARAVTDVFAGQPNIGASLYLRDLGRMVGSDGTEALPGFETQVQASEGYANTPIALGSATLLSNLNKVQRRNRVMESTGLATGPAPVNLDIEMETAPVRPTSIPRRCLSSTVFTVGPSSSSWCRPSLFVRASISRSRIPNSISLSSMARPFAILFTTARALEISIASQQVLTSMSWSSTCRRSIRL